MFLIEQWRIPILSDSCKNCMAESAKQTVLDESFEMAENDRLPVGPHGDSNRQALRSGAFSQKTKRIDVTYSTGHEFFRSIG